LAHGVVDNVPRRQCGTFRGKGFLIGSGAIQAACKTALGTRCRRSGRFWSEPGCGKHLALRCIHGSRRRSEFWKFRLNCHAACNDSLPLSA
jgi:hypothetical protein